MNNKYLSKIERINFLKEYFNHLTSEMSKVEEQLDNEIETCSHDIVYTLGKINHIRVYGIAKEYYCPICGKALNCYLNDSDVFFNKRVALDLEELKLDQEVVSEIHEEINKFIFENPNVSLCEIANYLMERGNIKVKKIEK